MEKVDEGDSLEFKWLKKRGVGAKKKEVQFYASFIYDGVEYELYDCVYMYKEGLQEPYIGMLTKIWENPDKIKKVKVHWFFRPEEISKWLGDTKTLKNEILLASGEGVGLANISPLEAIAGKCNVVCVSKDSRNPQPSNEELKSADFVFYRTFDVESCTILDNMDEKVGGIEIKYVFNTREDESISTLPESTTSDKKDENQNTITSIEPKQPSTKTLPNSLKDDTQDTPVLVAEKTFVEKTNSKIDEKADKVEANKRKNTDKLQDQPLKKLKVDDKNPPTGKEPEHEVARDNERLTDIPSKKSKADNSIKSSVDHVNKLKASVTAGEKSETSKSDKADKDKDNADKDDKKASKIPVDKERKKTRMESDKLDDRPLKKMKSPLNEKRGEVEGEKIEKMTDMPSKKSKVDSKSKDEDKTKQNIKNDKGKIPDEMEGSVLKKTKGEGEKIEKLTDMPSKKSQVDSKSKDEDKTKQNIKNDIKGKIPDEIEGRPLKKTKGEGEGENIEKLTDLPSKKSKVDSKTKDEDKTKENIKNDKGKISDEMEGRALKKTKGEGSFKIPENKKLNINTNGGTGKNLVTNEGKSKSVVGINNNNNNKEDQSNVSKKKLSVSKSSKDMYQEFVISPKPNAENRGWFKPLPWEQSLKDAYDQGKAVLLHNIDPDYTSTDVEDIMWHAFNEKDCEAKILPHSAISSPHCYQALILLKTKEAAQRVLTKLDEECLMLSNGRPLVATPCPPIIPRKNCKYFGHLAIDRNKINQRETEEAVSTSHFSQPNTIEYEMAMDWFLMQSKSKKWWESIYKLHGIELKKLEAKFEKK